MASPYLPANQGAALGLGMGGDADLVTITTPSGASFQVARKVAPQFQGFLKELSQTGYAINPKTSGGYNDRKIFGLNVPSQHAYGNAIDLNWDLNPRGGASNLPADVGDLAAKYGLAWGGNWQKPDAMHFEASRLVGGEPSTGTSEMTPDTSTLTPAQMLLARALKRTGQPIGTPAPTAAPAAVAPTTAPSPGLERLKAALASKAYDPDALSGYDTLMKQGQAIGANAVNPLGAIGGTLVAALGGGLSGYEGDKKKAFDEQLRQGLAQGEDTKAMARLLMASPDPKQQAMGVELFAQSEAAKTRNPEQFGTTPQYYTDPKTGELRIGQLSNKSGFKPVTVPGQILPGLEFRNLGTSEAGINKRTGEIVSNAPIDVAGKAQQAKSGEIKGENIAKKPEATLRIGNAFNDLDRLADEAKAIRDAPGLSSNYGMTGLIPNRPGSEASDAWARLASLKSQIANTVLQRMREASKTGGAVGNVSDAEQVLFQNNLAALDRAQSPDAVKAALDRIIDWTQGSKERVGRAYQETYGEPYQPGPAATATDQPSTSGYKVLKVH